MADLAVLGQLMQIAGQDESLGEILGELLDGNDLGGDDLAVLGAALTANSAAGKSAINRTAMARKLASAGILTPKSPSSAGVQAIGFVQNGIAANTAATITTQPQTWFKPMRLVVGESIAPFFTIDNIIVGNKSQFPSPVPLPAEMFIPPAEAVVMDLDTVNPALNLTLIVTNISGVAQNFRAGFVGKEITP
jgi:hypothetical protein